MNPDETRRRILWHGLLLFLLGLLTGLAIPTFTNARMGLAAHLEAVLNGIFLLALAGAWKEVMLPPRWGSGAFRLILYGTYANWITTSLTAVFGTAALTPLAAGTHQGTAWQEILVTIGFVSVALAMLGGSSLLLWGLRRPHRL